MPPDPPIGRIAVVGTGLVGAGWAAHFLARGMDVVATDPAANARRELSDFIDRVWPVLEQLGLSPGASRGRLRFTTDVAEAVADAEFVQESGPERIELKQALFSAMDAAAAPGAILASSSSGLTMSAIQAGCARPERCVIGHPFNPPYLIPLVEVVGGRLTSPDTIRRALRFYADCGKRPIHIRKEIQGHVANRLQAALWREAAHLVAEGAASVADVDAAVSWGPGLRWGVMGPNLVFHLGGGKGGMRHFMDHLSVPFATWWSDLGTPELTPELKEALIRGVAEEAAGRSVEELARERDRVIMGLLALRDRDPHT
jgi:3-hydroxyacyl-CoA dehydrogenase